MTFKYNRDNQSRDHLNFMSNLRLFERISPQILEPREMLDCKHISLLCSKFLQNKSLFRLKFDFSSFLLDLNFLKLFLQQTKDSNVSTWHLEIQLPANFSFTKQQYSSLFHDIDILRLKSWTEWAFYSNYSDCESRSYMYEDGLSQHRYDLVLEDLIAESRKCLGIHFIRSELFLTGTERIF